MVQHGEAPFLECSSRGDARFSAFKALLVRYDFRSIEQLYQSFKLFPRHMTGVDPETGHMRDWLYAKGRHCLNQQEAHAFYETLWREYIEENPHLVQVLTKASGLSDMFGQPGSVCQATILWKIRNEYL